MSSDTLKLAAAALRTLLLIPACLGSALVHAAEQQATTDLPGMPLSDPAYLLQVFFSLVVVVAAIFLLSLVLRKFDFTSPRADGPIRVLHSVSIGGKEQLILVEVGEDQILVGKSPGRVSTLHMLEQPISGLDPKGNLPQTHNFFTRLFNRPLS
jgi:flagellar protein FliO/FliZ